MMHRRDDTQEEDYEVPAWAASEAFEVVRGDDEVSLPNQGAEGEPVDAKEGDVDPSQTPDPGG